MLSFYLKFLRVITFIVLMNTVAKANSSKYIFHMLNMFLTTLNLEKREKERENTILATVSLQLCITSAL